MNNEHTFSNLHRIDNFEWFEKKEIRERLINSRKRTIEKIKVGSGGLFETLRRKSRKIYFRVQVKFEDEKRFYQESAERGKSNTLAVMVGFGLDR